MDWIAMLNTFFASVKATAEAVSKRTKPEGIQIEEHEMKKGIKQQDLNQEMLNDDFRYLKRREEMDISNYVDVIHYNMDAEERKIYCKALTERVTQYRKDVVKRKGINWKRYEEWLNK